MIKDNSALLKCETCARQQNRYKDAAGISDPIELLLRFHRVDCLGLYTSHSNGLYVKGPRQRFTFLEEMGYYIFVIAFSRLMIKKKHEITQAYWIKKSIK